MGIATLELTDGTGTVLECTTSGTVFGHRFDASVDVVEDFLKYLKGRHYDARELAAEFNSLLPTLHQAWDEFVEAYKCGVCGEGNVEHDDLDYSACCGTFHCVEHSGEEWSGGHDENYGHTCLHHKG